MLILNSEARSFVLQFLLVEMGKWTNVLYELSIKKKAKSALSLLK